MKEIQLTQGYIALVDDEDYEQLAAYKWCVNKKRGSRSVYALTSVKKTDGSRIMQLMHRFLLKLTDRTIQVDHINGDGLDNRRENLRIASNTENSRNRRLNRDSRSGFKGICHIPADSKSRPWRARIRHAGNAIYSSRYATAIEAAEAYNALALKYHGEFARLNEIPSDLPVAA